MLIIIDTREQLALEFECDTDRRCLKFGDYGAIINDKQIPVIFERKGLADLFGSLTFGYDRLRKVFERAAKSEYKLIIAIEGTKEKVLKGYKFSQRDPASIIKQLETIENKYGVTHIFFRDRREMSAYIFNFFRDYKEE